VGEALDADSIADRHLDLQGKSVWILDPDRALEETTAQPDP
jgi:hypothetical protein